MIVNQFSLKFYLVNKTETFKDCQGSMDFLKLLWREN